MEEETNGMIFPEIEGEPYETWVAGAIQLPLWLRDMDGRRRPWIAACLSLDSDLVVTEGPADDDEGQGFVLVREVVVQAARRWDVRPARVLVPEAGLARELGELLAPAGVRVEAREDLPLLRSLLSGACEEIAPPDRIAGPLSGRGVSVEQIRSFTRTAAGFFASGVWRRVSKDDLFEVESPEPGPGLHFLAVVGQSSTHPMLAFFEDEDAFDAFQGGLIEEAVGEGVLWIVELCPRWKVSRADAALWEREGLPMVGDLQIPRAYGLQRGPGLRPDSRTLDFLEGMLAALASTSEAELDSGRWGRRVVTFRGELDVRLSLPDLLAAEEGEEPEPVTLVGPKVTASGWRSLTRLMGQGKIKTPEEAQEFLEGLEAGAPMPEPSTPEEQALDLLEQAYVALGRRRLLLARRALAIWPDCAEAWRFLAGETLDDAEALDLFRRGVEAGERALGPEAFEKEAGRFGEIPAARSYLQVRAGLADALASLGRREEAVSHFEEILRLDPGDPLGAQRLLIDVLLELGRDEAAAAWLDRSLEDGFPHEPYTRALLAFRREGDSLEARQCLRKALQVNRFVPGLLLGRRELPPPPSVPWLRPGSEDEAAAYALSSEDVWQQTPGALEWLEQRTAIPRKPEKKGKEARRKHEAPRRPKKKKRRR
ncbi:MAG TPA: tetratricopeptide repeat protein [Thermoanaerobaculia bacterium]|nr:tetratricopeptide repeat protein [Thermoanaerobaculia bacterium]